MTLYVVTLPDPPAGEDFLFTVPGRYLYDVTGITAELTTGGGVSNVMTDSSGNGNDGIYFPVHPFTLPPDFDAGLVDGNDSVSMSRFDTLPELQCQIMHGLCDGRADFTVVWWESAGPAFDGVTVNSWFSFSGTPAITAALNITYGASGVVELDNGGITTWTTAPGVAVPDDAGHFWAVTYNATFHVAKLYLDGVLVPWVTTGSLILNTPAVEFELGLNRGTQIQDELAVLPSELAGADITALYAAGLAGFASWNPAVMAFTPTAFYHLADDTTGTGRQPSLVVSNGTNDLEVIPSGFPAVSTPGPYQYSWQPGLNADTQSTDGTLTTVAIPRLLLPAGYTVGPRTLDLTGTDQWSNVALWWDDAYQQAFDPFAAYEFPGGIRLVYHQEGAPA